MRNVFVRLGIVLCLLASGPLAAKTPTPLDLLSRPAINQVLISPTGEYLAVTKYEGDDNWLVIYNLPDKTIASSFNIGKEKEFARVIRVNDTHVVISLARRMFRDVKGLTGEIQSINAKTAKITNLGRGAILHTLPEDDKHILISGNYDQYTEVFRLNVVESKSRMQQVKRQKPGRRVARGPLPGSAFVASGDGKVLFAWGDNPENEREVYMRDGNDWRLVASHDFGKKGWVPFAEGPIPNTVLTWDRRGSPTGTQGLGLYDMKKDEHRMLFRLDEVDLSTVYRDFDDRVFAVRSDHHFPAVHYLNQKHPLARIQAELTKRYPRDFITFTSATKDNMQAIALVYGDRNPGEFVHIDLHRKTVELAFARRPNLDKEGLAEMAPVEVKARDGATVYGYVTSSPETPKPGPMIVYLHGGPHGVRDTWGFDPTTQLMAAQGAHVLQVNYRGSGGYGLDYETAGYGKWGTLMQDDVTDATHWAIQNKIADPEKICIYGASYGAYSALMGAAREPDLYACAVGFAGVYDLTVMDSHGDVRERKAGLAFIREAIGRDEEDLKSRSPVHLADRIKAGVFLIHGAADRRAPLEHARRMRDALDKHNGGTTEWYVDHLQGHGFAGVQGQLQLNQLIGDFMRPHLGIRVAASAEQ